MFLRRSFAAVLALALIWTVSSASLTAQMKTATKPVVQAKSAVLDINSAPEADIVALGIDKAAAKKIVDGRPYRNKREIVSRQFITVDQYDKLKDKIVAKQPKKGLLAMYARMVIGEAISETQVLEFARIYHAEVLPGLKQEPGFESGRLMIEDGGNMAVSLTVWDSRDACLRYHSSRSYRQFIAKTQHLLLGNFVVKLFKDHGEQ